MKIEVKKISELIKADYNPRSLSSKEESDLKASIVKFGLVDPPIINMHKGRENVIIGGHQRIKVFESLGNTTVPCTILNLNLELEKELNIRLNKNTGEFDSVKLKQFFKNNDLLDWGFDLWDLKDNIDEKKEVDKQDVKVERMEAFLYEHHDYIMIKFDKFQDFLKAVNIFDLRKVNVSQSEKNEKIGLGRVMSSEKFYDNLEKYVKESNT